MRQALDRKGFKDYPIIAGTATRIIEETAEQPEHAKEAGAQWGLVLVPGFFAEDNTQSDLELQVACVEIKLIGEKRHIPLATTISVRRYQRILQQ